MDEGISSRGRQTNSKCTKYSKPKHSLRQIQNELLAPIYDKVELLRRQIRSRQSPKNEIRVSSGQKANAKQHYMEMEIDKNREIERQRKMYEKQNQSDNNLLKNRPEKRNISTSMNWREHNRNKTKSLVNFLQSNKNNKTERIQQRQGSPFTGRNTPITIIQKVFDNNEDFQPVGKLYQQSLRGSQSQSLSSFRPDSSHLHMSKIGTANSKDSPRKYLRKGQRVRQVLMRQIQTAGEGSSGEGTPLTYMKQYDQWVPTTMIQQKRSDLQTFMNIMYGDKRAKGASLVDLDQINLVYL